MKEREHRKTTRQRSYPETLCAEPGCKFNGKRAAQGICFARRRGEPDMTRWAREERECIAELEDLLRGKTQREQIKMLKSYHVCIQLNWSGSIEELIRLRATNAELRLKLGKWK